MTQSGHGGGTLKSGRQDQIGSNPLSLMTKWRSAGRKARGGYVFNHVLRLILPYSAPGGGFRELRRLLLFILGNVG